MTHATSADDDTFRADFERFAIEPSAFDHRAHVRLAYIYLCDRSIDEAHVAMKNALLAFLRHHRIPESKYHETITRAWVMAVRHFMEKSGASTSAAQFIERHPVLLDSKIMLSDYSAEVLFSPEARQRFVEPDVEEIPRHR